MSDQYNPALKWLSNNERLVDLVFMLTQYLAAKNVAVTTLESYGLFQKKPVGIVDIVSQVCNSYSKSYSPQSHSCPPLSATIAAPRRSAPRTCAIAPLILPNVPLLLSHVVLWPPP